MGALSGVHFLRRAEEEFVGYHENREVRGMGNAGVRVKRGLITPMIGFVMLAGCHSKGQNTGSGASEMMAQAQTEGSAASAKKVGGAAAAIAEACAKVPYENARKGLIVAETGLHEDVFELRDRVSYQTIPFGLSEAERLSALLRKTGAGGDAHYPAQQAGCIREFAVHFQTLIDPLVEADAVQKQLDVSAFDSASKEAEHQAEQEEKAMRSPTTTNHE